MKCPNCEKDLIAVEREGLELNFCPVCRGFWFDAWEWDDLAKIVNVDKSEFNDLVSSAKDSSKINEKLKPCPICNRKMEKIETYGIILDRCIADGGVWFDGEELPKLLQIIADKTGINQQPLEKYLKELYIGKKEK